MLKYKWLAERLETLIDTSIRNGVDKLPTEQSLCAKYHVSRQTVRMALALLEQRGRIAKKQGSGSYITGQETDASKNRICVLISDDQDYIYPGVLSDITNTLAESGFSCQVFPTGNCVGEERRLLQRILADPPRGLIVEGCKSALPNPNLDLYRDLLGMGCAIIFLYNYYPALSGCLFIKDDNYSGSSLLVRHLASQGHTAIGGIFKSDDMQGPERYQGFVETLRDLGLPILDSRIRWYDSRELHRLHVENDPQFLRSVVQDTLSSCTAVVCYNDVIAYHLIDALLSAGFCLPQDMAITAFDNTYLSNSNILTVTTLSHEPHEMGTKAAAMLLGKLKGLPVHAQETRWQLNLKESTKNGESIFSPPGTPWGLRPAAF